ncbi:hypothetical protein [Actinophytocola sp.]|uniref:hypothetical protein n=1 Tax=Actinophytocola sp. TaxID=1872138 RepID=UPI0039C8BD29
MGRTTAFRYFDGGLLAGTTQVGFRNPNGTTRDIPLATYGYDGQGNVTRVEEAGVVTERTWDAAGNLSRVVSDPAGTARTTTYTYDTLDNPVTVRRTDGSGTTTETTDIGYDPMAG